jgi:hypothetical protein
LNGTGADVKPEEVVVKNQAGDFTRSVSLLLVDTEEKFESIGKHVP